MARIVYGISGEGSGHSSRARVILTQHKVMDPALDDALTVHAIERVLNR